MKKDINFTSYQLYINNEKFNINNKELFKDILNIPKIYKELKYRLDYRDINDNYLFLYFLHGKQFPYGQYIVNDSMNIKHNPKEETDTELNEQLFIFYCVRDDILYLSNTKKATFFIDFLKDYLCKEVIMKYIYKDIGDFCNTLKFLDTVTFSSLGRDLFSKQSDINNNLKDNYCIGEPVEFEVLAKYNEKFIPQIKEKIINNLIKKKNNSSVIKKLIIQGKDEQGFVNIFNADSFSKKINFSLNVNNYRMFESDDVLNNIKKILGIN